MLPWWVYLLGIVGALFVGAFVGSIIFFIKSYFQNRKIKKELPKGKVEVSKWLKSDEGKEITKYNGQVTELDEKEAEEDDRQRNLKYREFEKLRRSVQGKPTPTELSKSGSKQSESGSLSDKLTERTSTPESNSKRDISFDE